MDPVCVDIPDFPNYRICSDGTIINVTTGHTKNPSVNQAGVAVVNLFQGNRQHIRSVSVLVANLFLDRTGILERFDTPIHLNGDRRDCRVENLMWRPRWFAVKYHRQFDPWQRQYNYGMRTPVYCIETDEIFSSSWEAAVRYGLLDKEIYIGIMNKTPVFPTYMNFEEHIY